MVPCTVSVVSVLVVERIVSSVAVGIVTLVVSKLLLVVSAGVDKPDVITNVDVIADDCPAVLPGNV